MSATVSDPTRAPTPDGAGVAPGAEAADLVAALRRGDEATFAALVEQHHSAMIRLALHYVANRASAEDVVQETWMAVVQGIGRFEGRSSFKTWLFHILVNRAKTRGVREARIVPFSALGDPLAEPDEPAVDADRFLPEGHRWAGHWASPPANWDALPEAALLAEETRAQVARAIATLPPNQQTVIRLRDVDGWTAEEVCTLLAISEANQRVLLHRARTRVRAALEQYLATAPAATAH